jgi:hypothetical protein
MTWTDRVYDEFSQRFQSISKKNRLEAQGALANLMFLLEELQKGRMPEQLKHELSFVHSEPLGILAISEKHGARYNTKPKALRIYVFPSLPDSVLHILTMGDKATQPDDIKHCKQTVERLIAAAKAADES